MAARVKGIGRHAQHPADSSPCANRLRKQLASSSPGLLGHWADVGRRGREPGGGASSGAPATPWDAAETHASANDQLVVAQSTTKRRQQLR